MESIINFYRRARKHLPYFAQHLIEKIGLYIFMRKLIDSHHRYRYTDEDIKFTHILEAINYLRVAGVSGRVLPQTFFEFGCHSGRTFTAAIGAAQLFRMKNVEFYAFDSFEGLPETNEVEDGCFQPGSFNTSYQNFIEIVHNKTGLNVGDFKIVKGFYSDSLTSQVQSAMPRAGVVHIDVDLYSSTVDVLAFIKPLLVQGTVLLFDDWYCFPGGTIQGERRALTEFLNANTGYQVEPWKSYSTFGQSFFVSRVPVI
jgi:O-methyltransferase